MVNSSNTVGLISPFRFNWSTAIADSITIIRSWYLGPCCAGTPFQKAQASRQQSGIPESLLDIPKQLGGLVGV